MNIRLVQACLVLALLGKFNKTNALHVTQHDLKLNADINSIYCSTQCLCYRASVSLLKSLNMIFSTDNIWVIPMVRNVITL